MALQISSSDNAVAKAQDVFRLNQELSSGGDIFELSSSTKALSLGPDSDVADLLISYFDPQQPDSVNQFTISNKVPFVGRVDALLSDLIPSANAPARIIASVRDLVDNSFTPRAFGVSDFVAARVAPRIDLLAYLVNAPGPTSPPVGRANRSYFFPFVTTSANSGWYFLPYYGRTYGHVNFVNAYQVAPVTYTANVYGISFSAGAESTGAVAGKQGETLIGTLATAQNQTKNLVFGSADGMFDMLAIEVSATAALFTSDVTMRVTVSDS